jgi:hypothetical protein
MNWRVLSDRGIEFNPPLVIGAFDSTAKLRYCSRVLPVRDSLSESFSLLRLHRSRQFGKSQFSKYSAAR